MFDWVYAGDAPYNVVGDNVTDNTAGLNAALVAAYNKVLVLPTGRILTDPLLIGIPYNNWPATIIGSGGTMLVGRAPSTQATVTLDRCGVNMEIQGVIINANLMHDWGLSIIKLKHSALRNVTVQNGKLGGIKVIASIGLGTCYNTFDCVNSQQNTGPGWYLRGDGGDTKTYITQNVLTNCRALYNTGIGFDLDYVTGTFSIGYDQNTAGGLLLNHFTGSLSVVAGVPL